MASANIVIARRAQAVETATNELNAISRGLGIELPPFPLKKWPDQIHADADRIAHMATVLKLIREQVAPDEAPGPVSQPTFAPAQAFKSSPRSPNEPNFTQETEADQGAEADETTQLVEEGSEEEQQKEGDEVPQLTKEEARLLKRHKEGKKERNPEFAGHKLDHWEKVLEERKPKSEGEAQDILLETKGVGKSIVGNIMADLRRRHEERKTLQSAIEKQRVIDGE